LCSRKYQNSGNVSYFKHGIVFAFRISDSVADDCKRIQGRNVPRTVLIADDNRLIRDALCNIFEVEHDYELCAQATNGEEAVALAIEHKPDLIILDFAMPVMNGLEAARKLKQIVPKARIILFTVHAGLFKSRKDLPVELVVEKGAPNLMQHVREMIPV